MTKLSKRDHSLPGWVSNAPVQINVGRDLHIHGGGSRSQLPDDPPMLPRSEFGPGLVFAIGRLWAITWTLIKAAAWLTVALLSVAAWVVFGTLALSVWLLGRIGNLLVMTERSLGGAPTQLVYVPSILQPTVEPSLRLGPGRELADLDNIKQPERDYDHTN